MEKQKKKVKGIRDQSRRFNIQLTGTSQRECKNKIIREII